MTDKKKLLLGAMMIVVAVMLVSCGGGGSQQSTSTSTSQGAAVATSTEGPVVLSISWWGGDARHEATLKAIEAFEKKYPNITVEAQYGAWGGWPERVAVQMAGKSEPDVLQINWNWIYMFSKDGNGFTDLNKYGDVIDLSQYTPSLLEEMSIDGKLQGIPVGTTGKLFYWNKTTFDKAGIPVPASFAEMIAAGQTFKEKLGDDYYPMALTPYEQMLIMTYYLQQKYDKQWIVDKKVNFSVEEVTDGIDFLRSLEDAHVWPSQQRLAGDGADTMDKNPNWMNGKYAGFYEWDSAGTRFQASLNPGQEFVKGLFPYDFGDTKVATAKIAMAFAVSVHSQHPREAAMLVDFLLNDPEGVKIMGLERGIVNNAKAQEILKENGMLSGLVYESNVEVMKNISFPLDPYFEDSKLKDSTGLYFEVLEDLSYDNPDHRGLAIRLIDGINEVQKANL